MSAPCKYIPHQEAAPCLLNSHPSSSSCIQNPTSAPCIPCPVSASLPCTCSHIYISYPAPRILHPKIPHPHPAPCPVWPRRAAPVAPSQPSSRRAVGVPRSQPSTSGVWRFPCPQGLRPPRESPPRHIWQTDVAALARLCCPDGGRAVKSLYGPGTWPESSDVSLGIYICLARSPCMAGSVLWCSRDRASLSCIYVPHLNPKSCFHSHCPSPAPGILHLHSVFHSCSCILCPTPCFCTLNPASASHVLCLVPGILRPHPISHVTCPASPICIPNSASASHDLHLYPKFHVSHLHA